MNPTALDWTDLQAFLLLMREGSLSAAARFLNVTQPTVRRRLDALERSVGTVLFTRSPTGLTPTEAARDLGFYAEAMAAAADAFARTASADAGSIRGTVRITASDVVGAEVLPAMLAGLREAHPDLVLELHLSNRNEDLLRQEADIAIRMIRPAQAALVAQRVGVIGLGLFAHRSYLDRHGTPETIEALRNFSIIGPDRDMSDLRRLADLGFALPHEAFAIRTDNQLAHLGLIKAGLGIGICQIALGRRHPDLVHILPDGFRYGLETWVAMHEDLKRVERVRAVFGHLVRSLTEYAAETPG
ncbi:MAG TPA: LysR family transcriptional regulator [Aliidongia sp.]|nr:LysR family transcriptional regulator [Aliidongia sp.]